MVGQDFVTTGGTIRLRQWITSRYLVALTGGYEDAEYKSTTGKTGNSRHDQYFFVRPSVSIDFMKRMQLELYYQYRHNISTTGTSSFASNVAGLQATINF
jgi:hypothetical protein